MKFKKIVLAH